MKFGLLITLCSLVAGTVGAVMEPTLFGYTEPIRMAQAAFSESGILDEILVKEGAQVKEGDILARLDAKILEHDLNISREAMRIQELRHTQLEALYKQNSISSVEIERSRSDTLIAQERVERILAQLDARMLAAPFDGIIIRIFRERSESISSSRAEVLTIAKLDVLQVVLHVPVEKSARYQEGGTMAVVLEELIDAEATVVFVAPVIDAASRTIRVKLEIPNALGTLRAGMLCVPQE